MHPLNIMISCLFHIYTWKFSSLLNYIYAFIIIFIINTHLCTFQIWKFHFHTCSAFDLQIFFSIHTHTMIWKWSNLKPQEMQESIIIIIFTYTYTYFNLKATNILLFSEILLLRVKYFSITYFWINKLLMMLLRDAKCI